MNIDSIKNRAREVLMINKTQFIRVLVIVLVLNVIPSLLSATNTIVTLLRFILMIIFITVPHGSVVASLKMVRNNASEVRDEDGLVGFKRFSELFPTYIVSTIVEFVITFFAVLIPGIVMVILFSSLFMNVINSIIYNTGVTAIYNMLIANPILLLVFLIFVLIVAIIVFILGAYLFPVPYLLEQYHLTGMNNVKTSFKMMKGHVIDYIKLFFSFFGWMVLVAVIEGVLSSFISNTLIVSLIGGLVEIFTYLPLYTLSKTVLFEEISFYYFGENESEGV